jgi:membrane protease YdiL (CAAX protease family)
MFCPQCGAEYRPEFTRCRDCDVDLVEHTVIPGAPSRAEPKNPAQTFFVLTLALTWGLSALVYFGGIPLVLLFPAAFSPSLVALGLTIWDSRMPGVKALLRGFLIWRVGARWYLFAVFYMAAIGLAMTVAYRLIANSWPPFNPLPWLALVSPILGRGSSRVFVRASEEIGWRGYALPRLAERFGLRQASLILGPLWAAWHLPLFLIPTSGSYRQSFPQYVLEVTAISVVFAWLYSNTRCSLLLVTLMHSAMDETLITAQAVLPPSRPLASAFAVPVDNSWLFVGFLWIFAGYLLARMPHSKLIEGPQHDAGNQRKADGSDIESGCAPE